MASEFELHDRSHGSLEVPDEARLFHVLRNVIGIRLTRDTVTIRPGLCDGKTKYRSR
jgi:hypothetical protein